MRFLISAALALVVVAGATADTLKDGSVQVTPGKYKWMQETSLAGVPLKEENLECLIPEESKITLSKLATDLQKGCTVGNVRAIKGGYLFKLSCTGKTTGTADATLLHTDKSMTIHAKGSADLGPIPVGFLMKAQATYQGACTPDEVAKAKERYLKENPGATVQ